MNLFSLVNLDRENFYVNFKYLGNSPISGHVRLSWRGITTYHANFEFHNDESILYYISLNDKKIWDFIDFMDLIIETKFGIESFSIKSAEKIEKYEFLYNFTTNKKDTPYYTFEEIFLKKVYENDFIKINKNDVVVDIGANYGFFIKWIIDEKPKEIYCYEPSPSVFESLVNNLSPHDNVKFFNLAVSSKKGKIKFIDDISSASNRISDGEEGYEVDSVDINSVVENIFKKINFLKIDCEGCEKDIFETISSENLKKIEKIVVEYHTEEVKKIILNRLITEGFLIEDIKNNIIFTQQPIQKNKILKKKVVLISTFCDTEKKNKRIKRKFKNIKKFGFRCYGYISEFFTC